ncbi:MAG: hypothetical protein JSR54_18020, partial [Proteobacteria bacterium]|nr:hypothetical protein [Pseudomonadota bacterium]
MTAPGPESWLEDWRRLGAGDWERWLAHASAPPASGALCSASGAFTAFAEAFARLAQAVPEAAAAPERLAAFEALARDFFARALP